MSIKEKIQKKIIEAMKQGKKEEVETLRFLMARIKNFEIDKKAKTNQEITDEDVINLIRKIIKELDESIVAFEKGKRENLAQASKKQKEILSLFLPPELSDEELKKEIEKIINENQEIYQKNKKAIIGIMMKNLRGKVNSQRVLKILQEFLDV